jgi:hypothetical protein
MGSVLNTLMCLVYYSWANSRGQIIILVLSPLLYFFNYTSLYKEFILINILAFNFIQIVILNLSIKNDELVRFLNFYNISNDVISTTRLLFLYGFLLLHLLVFFINSNNTIKNFFILNLTILVFIALRLVSLTLNRNVVIIIFISSFLAQIAVLLFISSEIDIFFKILLLALFGLYKLRSQPRYT